MEFDPNREAHPQGEPSITDSDANAVASSNFLETQPSILVFRFDPRFLAILQHFQKAEWEECLKKLNGFLEVYPGDDYLLAFKDEIENRLKLQKTSQKQKSREKFIRLFRFTLRILVLFLLFLVALFLVVRSVGLAHTRELERQATQTAESLATQYQRANDYMSAGIPEDALRIYQEIKQNDPTYKDIDQKIESANEALAIVDLYNQGTQALREGKNDLALQILSDLEKKRPKYKDTPQLIEKIEQDQKIADLIQKINLSYSKRDWQGVVQNYEAIQAIDPFIQLPELKTALFDSYRYLILDISGRSELTLTDIETMDKYYHNAIALFPQSKDYAKEREELQRISADLQANKYYLQALALLKDSHYSQQGLQQAIRLLSKADTTTSGSPAITAGIEKAQLFLDSYNNLLNRRWDDAINGFEQLSRKDENYADGRVKYFLYEAYIARGDLLLTNAQFESALNDYQQAEKYAWSTQENILQLFQIEARLTNVLHVIGRDKDAAEFYHYVFDLLAYPKRLTAADDKDLLTTLTQADLAYKKGDSVEAVRLYTLAMKQQEKFYEQFSVSVQQGDSLVNIAFENGSTLESLRAANLFGESLVIPKNQELIIPVIPAIAP